jgi:hypothetical protein
VVSHSWSIQKAVAERRASRCRLNVAGARWLHWPLNHAVSAATLSSVSRLATGKWVPGGANSAAWALTDRYRLSTARVAAEILIPPADEKFGPHRPLPHPAGVYPVDAVA